MHPAGDGPRYALRPDLDRLPVYVPGLAPPPGDRSAVKLSSNENPLGPSPVAVEAMCRAAWECHRYPDPTASELRQALAGHFRLEATQIVVANGGDNLITLLAQVMLGPGACAVVPAVTFASYEIAARVSHASVERVPMRGHRIDVDGLAARAASAGRCLVFVCNPNNPTGTFVSRQEIERIVKALPSGSAVVLDEAYAEFAESPGFPDGPALVREGAPVIVLRTFSKVYALAGLRLGYALAPPPVALAMWRVREAFAANRMALAAAVAALGDGEHVRRSREMVSEGRRFLVRELSSMGLEVAPSEANFLWVRSGVPSSRLVPALAERGILVRPGDFWGEPLYIRVTVGTAAQNRRFVEALQEALRDAEATREPSR